MGIEITEQGLTIQKSIGKRYSERELLLGLSVHNAHADELIDPAGKQLES